MSQGKEYTEEEREEIIQSIKPYLELGYSINRACIIAGIPYQTVHNWVNQKETLGIRIKAWQNAVNAEARKILVNQIKNEKDKEISKWWLERREKNDFSTKQEQEIKQTNYESDLIIQALGLTDEDFNDENINVTTEKIRDYLSGNTTEQSTDGGEKEDME